jgi:sterol 3beta-glucosyltransferase
VFIVTGQSLFEPQEESLLKRIVIIAPGSRGDVQPYVALGTGLQAAGYRVRVVTTSDHGELVTAHGLELWPVETSVEERVRGENMRRALASSNPVVSLARMAREMKGLGLQLAQRSIAACDGGDALLAGISGGVLSTSIAEKTGLPLLLALNVPLTPTREFPGALFPGAASFPGGALNRLSHRLTLELVWLASRGIDRLVRQSLLRLPPRSSPGALALQGGTTVEVLYGFSRHVLPPPADWDAARVRVTGYWFLDASPGWAPQRELVDFLQSGERPIYVGFGSMSSRDPEATARTVLAAIRDTGVRAIVHRGWGGMQAEDLPRDVLMVDSVPHAWLLPRTAAVVHHGGAGTTAAGLAAGVPSIVVPFHGDQPFWARRVALLGAGPAPIPRSRLTADRLARAIGQAMGDQSMRERARDLGDRIRAERGIENAVQLITGNLARRGS